MPSRNPLTVFVYGTLKPGEANFLPYCEGKVIAMQPALIRGTLYDFPKFGYPALTVGEGWVQGYWMEFEDAAILADLDELEDYDPNRADAENIYRRDWVDVFDGDCQPLGQAWCYRMELWRVQHFGGVLVPEGHWGHSANPSPTGS